MSNNPRSYEAETLAGLERQMERGGLFAHTALSQNAERIQEAESFLYGLIDALIDKGVVAPDEVSGAARNVRKEMEVKGQASGPGIAMRVDAESAAGAPVEIDCAKRLPVCKAACCRLHFALSAEEVEGGRVRWDLGRPYLIRHEASGYCTHLDGDRHTCTVYDNRPAVCRRYDCSQDSRIWKDFEKMTLNEEWIRENLVGQKARLAWASIHPLGPRLARGAIE